MQGTRLRETMGQAAAGQLLQRHPPHAGEAAGLLLRLGSSLMAVPALARPGEHGAGRLQQQQCQVGGWALLLLSSAWPV